MPATLAVTVTEMPHPVVEKEARLNRTLVGDLMQEEMK